MVSFILEVHACMSPSIKEVWFDARSMCVGTEVSLEAVNELLALLAHEGHGNRKGFQHDESQLIISWPPSGLAGSTKSTATTEGRKEAELEALKDVERLQEELQSPRSSKWFS